LTTDYSPLTIDQKHPCISGNHHLYSLHITGKAIKTMDNKVSFDEELLICVDEDDNVIDYTTKV